MATEMDKRSPNVQIVTTMMERKTRNLLVKPKDRLRRRRTRRILPGLGNVLQLQKAHH